MSITTQHLTSDPVRVPRHDGDRQRAGGGRRTVTPPDDLWPLPATTHSYLARSADSLREAISAPDVPTRYACAHVAALQATAALLAARAHPSPARRKQKNAWILLVEVAPELTEWATFFAAGASKRAAAQAGSSRAVTEREADDLVRDADRFLAVVESSLGLMPHAPESTRLAAVASGWAERNGVA